MGLWVLTLAFCGVEGVDGAQRRESHGQAQAANNGQRKDAKHVAGGLSSGVEGVPYKVVVSGRELLTQKNCPHRSGTCCIIPHRIHDRHMLAPPPLPQSR